MIWFYKKQSTKQPPNPIFFVVAYIKSTNLLQFKLALKIIHPNPI